MISFNPEIEFKRYNVRVGHHSVVVKGRNEREAIDAARRQISVDLPRLWDVINSMDETQFIAEIAED